ncbi:MAG TPA: hypothetical protein VIS48_05205 [Candidatus Kryptonia bacterium]
MRRICAGIVVIVVTGVSAALYGQVHIRDTVSIMPRRAAASQDGLHFSMFILEKSALTVTNLTGSDGDIYKADFVLVKPWSEVLIQDALNNFGRSWVSPVIDPGTTLEFALPYSPAAGHTGGACDGYFDPGCPFALGLQNDSVGTLVITMTCWMPHLWIKFSLHRLERFDHFEVILERDTISHGDTSKVFVKAEDACGNEIGFPQDAPMTIRGATLFGTFIRPDGSLGEMENVPYYVVRDSGIRYIANGAPPEQTERIGILISGEAPQCFYSQSMGEIWIRGQEHTILLGETKYYYADDDEGHPDKLTIKESTTPENGDPNVVFDDPQIIEGDKLGVYWEYKDADGNDLKETEPGSIRLVGRYWEDGKTYKVKLSASAGGRSGSIDIEVKKPGRLGPSPIQANRDVFGNDQNIDELVLESAGRYGIPPQFLKAQIDQESSFYPAYRYEPFVDANGQKEFSQRIYDGFRVKSLADIGRVPIPSDHVNVHPLGYLGYQGTVWEYLYAHSQSINPSVSSQDNLYPIANSHGTVLWYSHPAEEWQNIFYGAIVLGASSEQAFAGANGWLKETYANGNMNKVAQTRLASSYGLFQVLYSTATRDQGYPRNDNYSPERLNESQIAPTYSVSYLLSQLESVLEDNADSENDWSAGFDETFRWAFSYYRGDEAKSAYGISIVDVKSQKYLPSANTLNP